MTDQTERVREIREKITEYLTSVEAIGESQFHAGVVEMARNGMDLLTYIEQLEYERDGWKVDSLGGHKARVKAEAKCALMEKALREIESEAELFHMNGDLMNMKWLAKKCRDALPSESAGGNDG